MAAQSCVLAQHRALVEAELQHTSCEETYLRKQQRRFPHCIFAARHGEIADTAEDPAPIAGAYCCGVGRRPCAAPRLYPLITLPFHLRVCATLTPFGPPSRHPGSGEAVRAVGRWAGRRRRWFRRLRGVFPCFFRGFGVCPWAPWQPLCPFWRLWGLYSFSWARAPAVLRGRRRGGSCKACRNMRVLAAWTRCRRTGSEQMRLRHLCSGAQPLRLSERSRLTNAQVARRSGSEPRFWDLLVR